MKTKTNPEIAAPAKAAQSTQSKGISLTELSQGWTRVRAGLFTLSLGGGVTLELRSVRYWSEKDRRYSTRWGAWAVRQHIYTLTVCPVRVERVLLCQDLRVTDLLASLRPVAQAPVMSRIALLTERVWPRTASAIEHWVPAQALIDLRKRTDAAV
jgi:hypothetical protein